MALLTLDEAKAQLNIDFGSDDTELLAYIEALTAVIERHVGPVAPRQATETIEGRGSLLCLTTIPVISLVSVTPALPTGSPLDLSTLLLDGPAGLVRRQTGTFAGTLWTVVTTVGRAEVAPTINLAARILLQHLWQTQYGAARGGGRADDFDVTEPVPGWGYAVPNRVLQLLEPFKLPSAVA